MNNFENLFNNRSDKQIKSYYNVINDMRKTKKSKKDKIKAIKSQINYMSLMNNAGSELGIGKKKSTPLVNTAFLNRFSSGEINDLFKEMKLSKSSSKKSLLNSTWNVFDKLLYYELITFDVEEKKDDGIPESSDDEQNDDDVVEKISSVNPKSSTTKILKPKKEKKEKQEIEEDIVVTSSKNSKGREYSGNLKKDNIDNENFQNLTHQKLEDVYDDDFDDEEEDSDQEVAFGAKDLKPQDKKQYDKFPVKLKQNFLKMKQKEYKIEEQNKNTVPRRSNRKSVQTQFHDPQKEIQKEKNIKSKQKKKLTKAQREALERQRVNEELNENGQAVYKVMPADYKDEDGDTANQWEINLVGKWVPQNKNKKKNNQDKVQLSVHYINHKPRFIKWVKK